MCYYYLPNFVGHSPFAYGTYNAENKKISYIHRDIKPSNIQVVLDEKTNEIISVKLLDLMILKNSNNAGSSYYTDAFESRYDPEFACRHSVEDFIYFRPECDLFSLMVTFYFLLTQKITVTQLHNASMNMCQYLYIDLILV